MRLHCHLGLSVLLHQMNVGDLGHGWPQPGTVCPALASCEHLDWLILPGMTPAMGIMTLGLI